MAALCSPYWSKEQQTHTPCTCLTSSSWVSFLTPSEEQQTHVQLAPTRREVAMQAAHPPSEEQQPCEQTAPARGAAAAHAAHSGTRSSSRPSSLPAQGTAATQADRLTTSEEWQPCTAHTGPRSSSHTQSAPVQRAAAG
uniref:Uncharacterized protein n=1 Tax=Myotis myotis TaxID=51298 RepID=A0A7J7Z4P3_MYOMY|nr:hypothetical protein mMyoMyo1_010570 [Myotis myotis]